MPAATAALAFCNSLICSCKICAPVRSIPLEKNGSHKSPCASITPSSSRSAAILIRSAPIKSALPLPSNAGPAAVAVHRNFPFLPSTISPFVPRSMNNCKLSALCNPAAAMPDTMSPPTNADIPHIMYAGIPATTICCGLMLTGSNGYADSGSTDSPQSKCTIVVFAAITIYSGFLPHCSVISFMPSARQLQICRRMSSACPCIPALMRDTTSAPYARCGLSAA